MKSILKLSLMLIVLSLVLVGCNTKDIVAPQSGKGIGLADIQIKATELNPDVYPIWAGQTILAGNMYIWNNDDYFFIKFQTTGGWMLEQTHVHITTSPTLVPGYPGSTPGQYDYQATHNPTVITYTYQIPRAMYPLMAVGDTIVIAAHSSVVNNDYMGGGYQQETGYGGDNPGPGPQWWYYMYYTITDDDDPPPPEYEYQYETAMVRMYDSPTDFTYRWLLGTGRPHAWFSYVKTYPAEMQPQTYYFYAGQSYKCGEVNIWKDGDWLKVEIDMMNDWEMTGSHVNVKLTGYRESPAFGNFPYTMDHDPATGYYLYEIPWNSDWDAMQLNVAVHADVQREIEVR